ncbi:phage terminase [Micromonospora sp. ATCC 39149]|uniref:PBSX family phage terminase large subunit n=1 Tax=Micromonospora sp. (strain ATCC 39149 / NRRL 15099 / SCC 1413) TaxID=219305 RepID=UPI0001A504DC|nr:PBSX family phage terminase large subunit [Micromonospora sp. ATCC 39149]EEP73514.1 phage terminase [Micromonospora sp. ATCC 39149]
MAIDVDAVVRQLAPVHIRSIVESTARLNIWQGSVRSGKTVASLLRLLMAIAAAPSSGRVLLFGKTRESVNRNVFSVLGDPALFGPLAHLVKYNPGAATGSILGREVDVLGANDAKAEPKVRGMTLCIAYGDELTTIPEAFFTQVLARLSVAGAQLFGTTNPDSPNHWLRKKYLLRAGELNLRTWHSTLRDNPHLDPQYVRNLTTEYVGLWYKRFILGAWVQAEGAVFDMWDEDRHVIPVLPAIHRWISLGIDYGTRNATAALILGVGQDGRLHLTHEWRHDPAVARRQLTDAGLSRELRAWLGRLQVPGATGLTGLRPEWTVVDPAAASLRLQLHEDGMTPALADNAVLDGIRLMSSLLGNDQLRVHASCRGLIDEIPGYSWDDKAAERGEDAPIKADDHSIDAARYAIKTPEVLWRPLLRSAHALTA